MKRILSGTALAIAGGIIAVLIMNNFTEPRVIERVIEQVPARQVDYKYNGPNMGPIDLTTGAS